MIMEFKDLWLMDFEVLVFMDFKDLGLRDDILSLFTGSGFYFL